MSKCPKVLKYQNMKVMQCSGIHILIAPKLGSRSCYSNDTLCSLYSVDTAVTKTREFHFLTHLHYVTPTMGGKWTTLCVVFWQMFVAFPRNTLVF